MGPSRPPWRGRCSLAILSSLEPLWVPSATQAKARRHAHPTGAKRRNRGQPQRTHRQRHPHPLGKGFRAGRLGTPLGLHQYSSPRQQWPVGQGHEGPWWPCPHPQSQSAACARPGLAAQSDLRPSHGPVCSSQPGSLREGRGRVQDLSGGSKPSTCLGPPAPQMALLGPGQRGILKVSDDLVGSLPKAQSSHLFPRTQGGWQQTNRAKHISLPCSLCFLCAAEWRLDEAER